MDESQVRFREIQYFRIWWVYVLLLIIAATAWWAFVQQIVFGRPFGDNPGPDWVVWIILIGPGILFPVLFLSLRLTTTVTDRELQARLTLFPRRRIPLQEIETATPRVYRPIREYWGWGIRWTPKHGMAYSTSGNTGVQLVLTDGKKVLIGSRRPEELAAAIRPESENA